MRSTPLFDRWSSRGASAQATVAGAYAWAVTVVPAAWGIGSPWPAKAAAGLAIIALLVGAAGERWGPRARFGSFWAFVLASAVCWSVSPSALAPARLDSLTGVAGMVGWGLFALAFAGPTLGNARETDRVIEDEPLEPRKRLGRSETAYVLGGALLGGALQAIGWREVSAERALLLRVVSVGAGLAIIGAAAQTASYGHVRRVRARRRLRAPGTAAALLILALLAMASLLFGTGR